MKHKREEIVTTGSDPTLVVLHKFKTRRFTAEVEEFQGGYQTRATYQLTVHLFASEVVKPWIGWLGRKLHQRLEERLALSFLSEVEHYDYWH